jgi:hypothetical protein
MEGGVSAIHKGLWLLFILGMVFVADWLMPTYGFSLERASWGWRGIQLGTSLLAIGLVVMLLVKVEVHVQTNQPTNQVWDQPTEATDIQLYQPTAQPDQPTVTVEPTNQPRLLPTANFGPEPADLSDAVKRSVYAVAREGSTHAAARRLNLSDEAVRKNVKKAREIAPEWVATVLEE